jgi:hypothetical protein
MKSNLILPIAGILVSVFLVNFVLSLYIYLRVKDMPSFVISRNGGSIVSNALAVMVQNLIGVCISALAFFKLRSGSTGNILNMMNMTSWLIGLSVLINSMIIQYSSSQLSLIDIDNLRSQEGIETLRNLYIAITSSSGFVIVAALAIIGYQYTN